ncbi:MAG: endonuclease/exonuclease/phosphatase family protein [Firmicutes bacterium]|nr:endonuclease/exonuclease/phosphatase family protein [Bacillota bacterium]
MPRKISNIMRVITWNCNRAFRKKSKRIVDLNPHIVVVPECENPGMTRDGDWISDFDGWRWFGDNNHQGVGVFVRRKVKIAECSWFDPEIRYIRPFHVDYQGFEFNMIAVWANNTKSPTFQYIGQVWKFLQAFEKEITANQSLFLGDFNSHIQWDVPDRWWNHSDVVAILRKNGIESLYHHFHGIEHGAEAEPTLYLQRNKGKPYHVDYVFASRAFIDSVRNVSVGRWDEWIGESDHMPIICDFDEKRIRILGED